MTATEQAVQQTLREYVAACNAGDADAYKATLAPDVVFCPPTQPRVQGRDAVGAWVKEGFFDAFDVTLDAQFDRIIAAKSEVLAPGRFSLDLKPKGGGDPITLTGTFFNIFREVSPGSWKYSWAVWNFQQPFG